MEGVLLGIWLYLEFDALRVREVRFRLWIVRVEWIFVFVLSRDCL